MLNLPLSLLVPLIFLLGFAMTFFFIEPRKSPQESQATKGKATLIARPSSSSSTLHQPSPPHVSPVVLGFQLASTGPAQDAAQLALRMKERQQLLIQRCKLEGANSLPGPEEDELAEEDDTAISLDPLPCTKTESMPLHQPGSSSAGRLELTL
jgi:hypothetical protein